MDREDIIRMAREAKADYDDGVWLLMPEELERFAALVAAAEREKFVAFLSQMHDAYALASDPPRGEK